MPLPCAEGKHDGKRFNKREDLLTFISTNIWKGLFSKPADSLLLSDHSEEEYMIYDAEPITNHFISVPVDMGNLNCAAYLAGIIAGILESANFPARVTALDSAAGEESTATVTTVYLIDFSKNCIGFLSKNNR